MIQTIMVGSCVSVQGIFVKRLPDGRIQVRTGSEVFTGKPVTRAS